LSESAETVYRGDRLREVAMPLGGDRKRLT